MAISTPSGSIEPFFFGSGDDQLYGCLHRPAGPWNGAGVVLCPPQGFEYTRSHRALRVLAERLARVGFASIRFDFWGCGDSAGEHVDARLERWRADIRRAADELEARLGPTQLFLLGRRLGGTLAAQVAAEIPTVRGLALWDPVQSGARYLEGIQNLHRQFVTQPQGWGLVVLDDAERMGRGYDELLGYRFSEELRAELATLDLASSVPRSPAEVLIVDSRNEPKDDALVRQFETLGARVVREHLPDPEGWEVGPNLLRQLVPNDILKAITGWAREVSA